MPSTSPAQHRFMQAIAHNPQFAQKAGVPQSVGQDFASADKAQGKFMGKKKPKNMQQALANALSRN